MRFTKMQGCGNDYVYINCFTEQITQAEAPALARWVSDRRYGIGADGLILIRRSTKADCTMEMYNADGSRAQMCGNGIRCVGKLAYEQGLVTQTELTIETDAGLKQLTLLPDEEGAIERVRVNMGRPVREAARIPVCVESEGELLAEVKNAPLLVNGIRYAVTCVSMGNPHAVVYVPEVDTLPLEALGPQFECHPAFPEKINTEFVQCLDKAHLKMRVWERGSGETFACGTGACACAYASMWNGYTDSRVLVDMVGGTLEIAYEAETDTITMTGPAVTVFTGEFVMPHM